MNDYLTLVTIDKTSINTIHKPCPTNMLVKRHGMPRRNMSDKCQAVTNQYWRSRIVTKQVHDEFRITGFDLFVDVINKCFDTLKLKNKELYDLMGTEGCLCCRLVRGSKTILSNHGLGFAIDLTIGGQLDTRGDGKVQKGMFIIYSIFKQFGLYWGAGFPTEDGMHFEASDELVAQWIKELKL